MQDLAERDSLTGAANRRMFQVTLERTLAAQAGDDDERRMSAVLFIDLDDFKVINDSLGHAAGDSLLIAVTDRIGGLVRNGDLVARLGGDEFAILTEDVADLRHSRAMAERLVRDLRVPYVIGDHTITCSASIGIAGARDAGRDAAEVVRNADVAMYMSKANGKSGFAVFDPGMHASIRARHELGAELQHAVDRGQLRLVYQPIVSLESGRISGLEALVRWQHPDRGLVAPGEFIEIAEENGAILPIGRWVLREACTQARNLQERYVLTPPLHMAVNLSARQLQRPEIVGEIAEILLETELSPHSLVLEITESVMMQDMDLSIQRLAELKELGVRLAVDDFGTGYSSLNYIRRFPVDILKVDKSFVDGVNEGGEESALTAAIIELAGILRLRPVAEGIERADQLEKLLALRCDLGQGFYFAKPLPLEGVDELLTTRQTLATRENELST